jgi:hypothetical protein
MRKTSLAKPNEIKAIYDNQKTLDRYTIVSNEHVRPTTWAALVLSQDPDWPQGVSQWTEVVLPNPNIGREISWEDLPSNVQRHIIRRLHNE